VFVLCDYTSMYVSPPILAVMSGSRWPYSYKGQRKLVR